MVQIIQSFGINLYNNSYRTYMAGSSINGCVDLILIDRLKINAIKIKVYGEARIHFTEQKSNGRYETTVSYTDSENYIDLSLTLFSKKSGDTTLNPGKNTFPFEIQLPANLPASFEHQEGKIRYFLCATVEIPWSLNKNYKIPITVICLIDLNNIPRLKSFQSLSNSKTICCLCCKSKPINIELNLFQSGFVSGEVIIFNALINNQSSRKISSVVLKLIQIIKLSTRTKSKFITRECAHIELNREIKSHTQEDWNDSVLKIPSTCPSSMKTSRIIEVNYYLELFVEPRWPSTSLNVKIPIVIGTIPFSRKSVVHVPNTNKFTFAEEHSPNYDLPSYQECVFSGKYFEDGGENDINNNSEINEARYRPMYPFFDKRVSGN